MNEWITDIAQEAIDALGPYADPKAVADTFNMTNREEDILRAELLRLGNS
jgi:hypothetical protein